MYIDSVDCDMQRKFDLSDVQAAESRDNLFYFVTTEQNAMIAATHVGPKVAGMVDYRNFHIINWRVYDMTGRTIAHGEERNIAGTYIHYLRCLKRAVKWMHAFDCTQRVRPGDTGPWFGTPHGE